MTTEPDTTSTAASDSSAPAQEPTGTLCPYCGGVSSRSDECDICRGLFEPLSKQASQNAMGPWYIRDLAHPFRPGCSFATLKLLAARGRITPTTVLRGPSTRQFWLYARQTPGVANLLGACHACRAAAKPDDQACTACGASFRVSDDRDDLGLAPVRALPAVPGAAARPSPKPSPRPASKPAPAPVEPDPDGALELAPPDPPSPHREPAFEAPRIAAAPAASVQSWDEPESDPTDLIAGVHRARARTDRQRTVVLWLFVLAGLGVLAAIGLAVLALSGASGTAATTTTAPAATTAAPATPAATMPTPAAAPAASPSRTPPPIASPAPPATRGSSASPPPAP